MPVRSSSPVESITGSLYPVIFSIRGKKLLSLEETFNTSTKFDSALALPKSKGVEIKKRPCSFANFDNFSN